MLVGPGIDIAPAKFRRLYALFLVGGMLLIWSSWWVGNHLLRSNVQAAQRQRLEIHAALLEDHVTRTLDAVASRLRGVAAVSGLDTLRSTKLSSESLREVIFQDALLRSVSLVDASGRVLASSNAGNVGVVLPADFLPVAAPGRTVDRVRFGGVFAQRDLAGLSLNATTAGLHFWVAATDIEIAGNRYQWVAAVNPQFFENFWQRVHRDTTSQVDLMDYSGQRIASYNEIGIDVAQLALVLKAGVAQRAIGALQTEAGQPLAYRASSNHAVVLSVIGDPKLAWAQSHEDRQLLWLLALMANGVLLLVLGLMYRNYLRYEKSMIDMGNHATAINAHVMFTESDARGNIVRTNEALLARTGYSAQELQGSNHRIFNSGYHHRAFYQGLWTTVTAGVIWKGILRNRDRQGNHFWVNATIVPFKDAWGQVSGFMCLYSDITDSIVLRERLDHERQLRTELSELNRALMTEANTDPLTGAANRRGFDHFAEQAIHNARQFAEPLSFLMLDLDHFKRVNDSYGHASGDVVLREMAQRWQSQLRTSDMLARIGGEEFCVVLPQTPMAQAWQVAQKLLEVTRSTPIPVQQEKGSLDLTITVSIGIACAEHLQDLAIQQLLERADAGLYQAKNSGRNQIAMAQPETPREG